MRKLTTSFLIIAPYIAIILLVNDFTKYQLSLNTYVYIIAEKSYLLGCLQALPKQDVLCRNKAKIQMGRLKTFLEGTNGK